MSTYYGASAERREAIKRASAAMVRLAVDPEALEVGHVQMSIATNLWFSDREAWDAVGALEYLLVHRGIVTMAEVEATWARERAEAHERAKTYGTKAQ